MSLWIGVPTSIVGEEHAAELKEMNPSPVPEIRKYQTSTVTGYNLMKPLEPKAQ
jgi:hypothetical protein